jgi:hypothetical protein
VLPTRFPISFTENRGQFDSQVRYAVQGSQGSAFFTNAGVVLDLSDAASNSKRVALKLTFDGAGAKCVAEGRNATAGTTNYIIGNKPSGYHTGVHSFAKLVYAQAWPGIDIVYRGLGNKLKYDIRVHPGAEVKDIRLKYEGADRLSIDNAGDLHIHTAVRELVERVPGIYQIKNGLMVFVKGGYALNGGVVSFSVKHYDHTRPLIIDPASDVAYSTLLGGAGDEAMAVAVDSAGNAYVVGQCGSSNFPYTSGAYQTTKGSTYDAYVMKINPSGSARSYATLLGGNGTDYASAVAVDSAGCAYVVGSTYSSTGSDTFPTTGGAFQTTYGKGGGGDGFITKLNPTGTGLIYSSYFGGSGTDACSGVAVDSNGCAYITGSTGSNNLPGSGSPGYKKTPSGNYDAFVAKVSATGSSLVYSTYLGGAGDENGSGIAIDSSGCAYVTGYTMSSNFPITSGAYRTTYVGNQDAFVTKLSSSGTTLVYSTYLGGSAADSGQGIAVDAVNCAYVTGYTESANFPTTGGAFKTAYAGGGSDAFVTKLNSSGSALVYSTYLGGASQDEAHGIAVDLTGCAYVTGATSSTNFPTTTGAYQTAYGGGSSDAFVTRLNQAGTSAIYSTYLGGNGQDCSFVGGGPIPVTNTSGVALDPSNNAYIAGFSASTNFPSVNPISGAPTSNSGFLTKISMLGGVTTISGVVTLSHYVGNVTTIPVTIIIRNAGTTTVVETHTVYLTSTGAYSFTTNLIGTFDLLFKASHWLQKKYPNVQILGQ